MSRLYGFRLDRLHRLSCAGPALLQAKKAGAKARRVPAFRPSLKACCVYFTHVSVIAPPPQALECISPFYG